MTIDERLQFLLTSTESLHASVQELHGVVAEHTRQMEAQRQIELKHRLAIIAAIRAYLDAMGTAQ